ncbi:uncharacterized protein LOC129287232 isoform X2 [Prosopis cineraria]|uniref:uncharacterized protein LOC129287232 isoform X2 n=1 Tax=Prosopis cineraria TaxID=364024 RepID=UPI00240FE9DC|nr:uncharacterized protein LOC129287232 isoform X2 [Prosopis cineraria]
MVIYDWYEDGAISSSALCLVILQLLRGPVLERRKISLTSLWLFTTLLSRETPGVISSFRRSKSNKISKSAIDRDFPREGVVDGVIADGTRLDNGIGEVKRKIAIIRREEEGSRRSGRREETGSFIVSWENGKREIEGKDGKMEEKIREEPNS